MRGLISPTVIRAIVNDPEWHAKFIAVYGGSDGYDLEGYDAFGYNLEGKDRAGNSPEDYRAMHYYEMNEDRCDAGEDRFITTLHDFMVSTADDGVGLPVRSKLGFYLRDDLPANNLYVVAVDEFGMIRAEVG